MKVHDSKLSYNKKKTSTKGHMSMTPWTCAINTKWLKYWLLGSYVLVVFEAFEDPLGYEMYPEEAGH